MFFAHQFGPHRIEKQVPDSKPALLLTNHLGGFLHWQEHPTSRYQGWYIKQEHAMLKVLEGIELGVRLNIKRITNHFSWFEVERDSGFKERFFLDPTSNSLIWHANTRIGASILVDGKEIFDNDEWERFYDITEEDDCVVIAFTKKHKGIPRYHFFLVITGTHFEYAQRNEWVERQYPFDRDRLDPPFQRFVFRAIEVKGTQFVFSAGTHKEKVKKTARRVLENATHIAETLKSSLHDFALKYHRPLQDPEIRIAYLAAKYSLARMVVHDDGGKVEGLYAGIPWLTQFWFRDCAISARQLDTAVIKALFARYLEEFATKGSIKACTTLACLDYADTEGLFFWLAAELHARKLLTPKELEAVRALLVRHTEEVFVRKMHDGFVMNGPKETWMDSEYRGSARSGARIEIQALALRTLKLAGELTSRKEYAMQEAELLRHVRASFWNGTALADGQGDFTQRPNVFLAFRFYPQLLSESEWKSAFLSALEKLWLEWGGIASLPKDHPLFCGTYRGCNEPNQSYHHGDSWFFINNLAAEALFATDALGFRRSIDALLSSSTHDILWNGMYGQHSELSSADLFMPGGCFAQSWSCATYLDALDRIMQKHAPF